MTSEADLISVIGAIYEAAVNFDLWPDALGRIVAAVGACSANFVRQGPNLSDWYGISDGIEPEYDVSYLAHYHSVNPFPEHTRSSGAGAIHTDAMVVPWSDLNRTEFFHDFLAPQGIRGLLNAVIIPDRGWQMLATLHTRAPVEDRQIALYRLIAPHLQRAAALSVQLADADIGRAASAAVLDELDRGVLLVDERCKVIFANRAAEAMLAAGEGLAASDGILRGNSMPDTSSLHGAVSACCGAATLSTRGSFISLSRSGRPPLFVRISPVPPSVFPQWLGARSAAILCVTDPDHQPVPPAEELRKRFGLTRAEAVLAIEILEGDGVQAAADRMSITRATARTHLAHIFEKTGVHRQSELVRLLLSHGLSMRLD